MSKPQILASMTSYNQVKKRLTPCFTFHYHSSVSNSKFDYRTQKSFGEKPDPILKKTDPERPTANRDRILGRKKVYQFQIVRNR